MKTNLLLVLSVTLIAGCLHSSNRTASSPAGIPDDEIGLSKVDILTVSDPLLFRIIDIEPGEAKLPPPAFFGAPPVISHTLEDMIPITRSDNSCLDCHAVEVHEPGEATPIPDSHFFDLRNAPEVKQKDVVGARYNCTMCHAAESYSKPLVQNLGAP